MINGNYRQIVFYGVICQRPNYMSASLLSAFWKNNAQNTSASSKI